MGKVILTDCTLRDGGYVNNWEFGERAIKDFGRKIARTGIEIYEIGFIKGKEFDRNRAVFPDISSIREMIEPKSQDMMYVAMIDMGDLVPLSVIPPFDGTSIDGIRVIFKKEKMIDAYQYCKEIQEKGYLVFVQLVGSDDYSDREFIDAIEMFNQLNPYAISIVDSFGLIKRKQFLRLVHLADNNMKDNIVLGYHAHNNLQMAFGNAEALVDMNLKRDVCIDACVFGMGRGAGNLNLELFADFMNENYDTQYRIEPMLELMDEYLHEIYKKKFWGYSLPLYLSAINGCHPNYAIYLAEKDTLTEKSFNELLKGISKEDKRKFSKELAQEYYTKFQENYIDDLKQLSELEKAIQGRDVLILAPGQSLIESKQKIEALRTQNVIVFTVNFLSREFAGDYIFSSNMRRYVSIEGMTKSKCIITSNMREAKKYDYMLNFSSFSVKEQLIEENAGLMLLNLLIALGIKKVYIAGMDGYEQRSGGNYFETALDHDFSHEINERNTLIAKEIDKISKVIDIHFLTPSIYKE